MTTTKAILRCHTNQISISFTYDVLGKSPLMTLIQVAITSMTVTDPINLSPGRSMSTKRVEYTSKHSSRIGMNVLRID